MEQSPLGSTTSDPDKINGSVNDRTAEKDKSADQRLVADQLMAALASGNLDHRRKREKFLKHSYGSPRKIRTQNQ